MHRRIVHEAKFLERLHEFFGDTGRGKEILREFSEALARSPERGYAVQGAPDYSGIPLRADDKAFLVIYWYDDECVHCVNMRPVPGSAFGDAD